MAFGIPVFVFGFIWIVYMPKNNKTAFWAKVFRQTIFMAATDSGQVVFYRGHTEGPGVFRSHDGSRIDFIPRESEAWINKTFHGDKIPYLIGYVGKAVAGSFETIAVLRAHELLREHKNKINGKLAKMRKQKNFNSELEMQAVFSDFLKNNKEGKELMEKLKQAQANVMKEEKKYIEQDGKKLVRVKRSAQRLVAILLDPRIIQYYITNTLQPSQSRHVHDVGYRQGYRDGSNPAAKFKMVFILLIIAIPTVAIILLLLLGGGGTAAV